MSFSDSTSYTGQQNISTFNGDISLDTVRGRLVIRDPSTGVLRNVQDIDGTHIYDDQGREMTRVDTLGLTTIEPVTGIQRGRSGIASGDGRSGNWYTKPGIDLRDEGI